MSEEVYKILKEHGVVGDYSNKAELHKKLDKLHKDDLIVFIVEFLESNCSSCNYPIGWRFTK